MTKQNTKLIVLILLIVPAFPIFDIYHILPSFGVLYGSIVGVFGYCWLSKQE